LSVRVKIDQFKKNKLGLSLSTKKEIFWAKNWRKKIWNKVQKLTNFKEKKRTFRAKKTSWG